MSTLAIVSVVFGLAALALWIVCGAVWFAGLIGYNPDRAGHDEPRIGPWQIFAGGPLIWFLHAAVWVKEREHQGKEPRP